MTFIKKPMEIWYSWILISIIFISIITNIIFYTGFSNTKNELNEFRESYSKTIEKYMQPSMQDTIIKVNGTVNIYSHKILGNHFSGNGTINILTDGEVILNYFGKGIEVNIKFIGNSTKLEYNASYKRFW
jgi:hypothetical protein